MSTKSVVLTLVRRMKADPRFKRLDESVNELPLFNIPAENFERELSTMHLRREARRLAPESNSDARSAHFIDKLIVAIATDQSYRSRCTEIRMECFRARSQLSRAVDKLSDYFLLHYQDEMRIVRTKEERLMLLGRVLRPFKDYVESMDRVIAVCDMLISDIDKAAWAIKAIVDTVKVHAAPERNI